MDTTQVHIAVPKAVNLQELQAKINDAWEELSKQLPSIALNNGASLPKLSEDTAKQLSSTPIEVSKSGAGTDPELVALVISLQPIIKALTPILSPIVKSASKVGEKVALDVWAQIKAKLWEKDHIRIVEKKSSRAR